MKISKRRSQEIRRQKRKIKEIREDESYYVIVRRNGGFEVHVKVGPKNVDKKRGFLTLEEARLWGREKALMALPRWGGK